MKLLPSAACWLGSLLLAGAVAAATPPVLAGPPAAPEQFVQVCTSELALTSQQSASLREYLEQEMNFLAVQRANHTAAEVAQLLPAERAEFQQVASHLMSPTQLRRFRELEATPKMREYLRQMDLR